MIFSRLVRHALLQQPKGSVGGARCCFGTTAARRHGDGNYRWKLYYRRVIGNREQVGFGWNGNPAYQDLADFPFPSIRYKEPTAELKALHEKEKGDWKELSIDEKKCLYRASFCLTFAEFQAPTGEWKSIFAWAALLISAGLWLQYFMYAVVYSQVGTPVSLSEESFRAQLRRQIDLHVGPMFGLASQWDYGKCDWKEPNKWFQLPNPFIDPCTGERECNNYRE